MIAKKLVNGLFSTVSTCLLFSVSLGYAQAPFIDPAMTKSTLVRRTTSYSGHPNSKSPVTATPRRYPIRDESVPEMEFSACPMAGLICRMY